MIPFTQPLAFGVSVDLTHIPLKSALGVGTFCTKSENLSDLLRCGLLQRRALSSKTTSKIHSELLHFLFETVRIVGRTRDLPPNPTDPSRALGSWGLTSGPESCRDWTWWLSPWPGHTFIHYRSKAVRCNQQGGKQHKAQKLTVALELTSLGSSNCTSPFARQN